MKTLFTSALLLTAMTASLALAKPVELDTAASSAKWLGKKVTGQHNGTVALKSGTVDLEKGAVKGGEFEIDMATIKNEDIKDEKNNTKLVGHLKSDDFFGVEKHPTAKFKIKSVKELKGNKEATHEVTGDLTIKGKTETVTFPAQIDVKGEKATAKAKIVVDRTKFDVRYGSGKFFENLGDKMINDNFDFEVDLKTK
jgi:polyisoprenoid-binding protein YceI